MRVGDYSNYNHRKIKRDGIKRRKLPANEKLFYRDIELEVAHNYKYLDVTSTPSITYHEHVVERVSLAKCGLNSVWKNLIGKERVFQCLQN